MRRLAQELDVWPMSVYRHFRDKEDLLDAVAAAGADLVDLPPARGGWRPQLAALAREAHATLARQPAGLRRRTLISPGVLRLTDAALGALRRAGLSPAQAATAWRAVLGYVVGSIELEAATGTERELQALLLGISEEDHPELSGAAAEVALALAGGAKAFDVGLERVLDGIAPRG
jgi:AcrR family transcriptional regulator